MIYEIHDMHMLFCFVVVGDLGLCLATVRRSPWKPWTAREERGRSWLSSQVEGFNGAWWFVQWLVIVNRVNSG